LNHRHADFQSSFVVENVVAYPGKDVKRPIEFQGLRPGTSNSNLGFRDPFSGTSQGAVGKAPPTCQQANAHHLAGDGRYA